MGPLSLSVLTALATACGDLPTTAPDHTLVAAPSALVPSASAADSADEMESGPVLVDEADVEPAEQPPVADDSSDADPSASDVMRAQAAQTTAREITPALPRLLDFPMPAQTGRTIAVRAGDDLQAAIDAARYGDVITLERGATFRGTFRLRAKPGSGWIVIRTAGASLPAEGQRVLPRHAAGMAKLVTVRSGTAALKTDLGARGYRIVGVEITAAPSVRRLTGLVNLGDGSNAQNSMAKMARDLVLDRVYVHGNPELDLRRCVALNSASTAIIDSYLSECHAKGADSQAIGGWNGAGPYKIVNNYLEGAGENVMFGGADPGIHGLIPTDIEIRRNYFFKPLDWKEIGKTSCRERM